MNKKLFTPFIFSIIGLAVIGIAVNPLVLLNKVLIFVIIGLVFYLLYKVLSQSTTTGNKKEGYNRAAKQSKQKYTQVKKPDSRSAVKKAPTSTLSAGTFTLKKKRTHSPHLTVIEGKKGKKKDRASF